MVSERARSLGCTPTLPSLLPRFRRTGDSTSSPPIASMATAPSTTAFPVFPSANTHTPPPLHGGYCCYPPPFPYAFTYPYTHPAAAYAPPPGFFPAPPHGFFPVPPPGFFPAPPSGSFPPPVYGPSTVPYATTTQSIAVPPVPTRQQPQLQSRHHTPDLLLPRSTSSEPNSSTPVSDSLLPSASTKTILPLIPASKVTSGGAPAGRTVMEIPPYEVPCTAENARALCTGEMGVGKSCSVVSPTTYSASTMQPDPAPLRLLQDSKLDNFQCHVTGLYLDRLPSSSSTTTGQTTSAVFTPASGSMAKVASAPSMFSNTSVAASNLSSPFGPSFVVPTSILASVSATSEATSASTVPSVTTSVAPQMFGEMPAQKSCQGKHGTAPGYSSGHENPIQNSCLQSSSTGPNWQNLVEMPRPYGFHSLNRQTVVLADGTERSYFALPENYPLARATSKKMSAVYGGKTEGFSTEFVDVFVSAPEQPKYDAQGESEQAPKCFCQPIFSPVRPTDGVFSFTSEKKQDSDQLLKCFSRAPKTEQTSAHVSDYAIEQEQNGETASLNVQQLRAPRLNLLEIDETRKEWDIESNSLNYVLQSFSHPPMLSYSFFLRYCSVKGNSWLNTVRQSMSDRVEGLNPLSLTIPWDPGDARLHVLFTTNVGATKLPSTHAYKCAMIHILDVQFGARRATIFQSAIMRSDAFGRRWTTLNTAAISVLVVPCSKGKSAAKHGMFLSNGDASMRHHDFPMLLMQFLRAATKVQATEQRYLVEFSLLVEMSLNASDLDGQLAYRPQHTSITSSEWWYPGIANSSYMYFWPEMRAVNIFSDLQYQLQLNRTFSVWDPGILSLWDMMLGNTAVQHLVPSGLHTHRIQLADCAAIHACNLGSALLLPTQITASGSSNIEVDELTSRYYILHLHQITNWTSTTSNGITSAEYAYTMDFINDPRELIHQQGVQENYNAEHLLLSSQDCVKIREIDIIFMTFRPP